MSRMNNKLSTSLSSIPTRLPKPAESRTATRTPLAPKNKVPLPPRSAARKDPIPTLKRTRSTNDLSSISAPKPKVARIQGPASSTIVRASEAPKKPRRPAWDLKGKIEDMQDEMLNSREKNKELFEQMSVLTTQVTQLLTTNQKLSTDVEVKATETSKASEKINNLENTLRDKEQAIQELTFSKATLERQQVSLQAELDSYVKMNANLKVSVADLSGKQTSLQAELETIQIKYKDTLEKNTQLEATLKEKDEAVTSMEEKLRQAESLRRQLHNTIQELKGNVRVFCRIRPSLSSSSTLDYISYPEANTIVMTPFENPSSKVRVIPIQFQFDSIFKPKTTQEQVFEEISQLVQSVLDGFNVSIFAYGQTGSGKTFTMEGPANLDFSLDHPNLGMIPRSIQQIFDTCEDLKNKGWKYVMGASFLEIYNETIRDLLGNPATEKNTKHEIKMSSQNSKEVSVTNLTLVAIQSKAQVRDLLQKAHRNRAVASTNANEHSSRSHSVFRLKLNGSNNITGEACEGTLNLIDLAGSERLKDSGADGDRLRELKNINKSLSNLGNVILALGQKSDHVPYRNSKLTHLLMNSLGGNSKTLMFVNISPQEEHYNETLNSLRFATKVNQCHIGTATKQIR